MRSSSRCGRRTTFLSGFTRFLLQPARAAAFLVVTTGWALSGCDDGVAPMGLLTAGQVGGVEGIVSADDGARMVGVQVTLSRGGSTGLTTATDSRGFYSFSGVAPGVWTVQVAVPPGFVVPAGASSSLSVEVFENEASLADFVLERLPVI
jgi:hypothetical protein